MTNRDGREPNKRAERQTALAGKLAYHRVPKLVKKQQKLKAKDGLKSVTIVQWLKRYIISFDRRESEGLS